MTAKTQPATLVEGAIARPDEPRHFMVIERAPGRATARVGDTVVAASDRALVVKEVGRGIYDPVIYFPPGDVDGELLAPVEKTTHCPLKGDTRYYDIVGDSPAAEAAWSYRHVLDFDPRLEQLLDCVAFDRAKVTIELTPTP